MKFGPGSLLYYLLRDDSPVTACLLGLPWCPPITCCCRCRKSRCGCPGLDRLRCGSRY
ncbi:MAG: hypothetical protein GXX99_00530 [Clostridiales bacterium]|nr:hypothetical protein [Clostridiales bacterium]